MLSSKNIVIIIVMLMFLMSPGVVIVNAASLAYKDVPSWIDVNITNNIIILKIKPSYYLDNGVPVIVVDNPSEVRYLAEYGVSAIVSIGFELVGDNAYNVNYVYEGPGYIVGARVSSNNSLLVFAVGDIDLRLLKIDNKYVLGSYDKIVIISTDFNSNICGLSVSNELSRAVNSTLLKEVLVEVLCYPPIVAVDKTILEEQGYTAYDVVEILRNAGVDNFYLFLVSNYKSELSKLDAGNHDDQDSGEEVDTESRLDNQISPSYGVYDSEKDGGVGLVFVLAAVLIGLAASLFVSRKFT